MSNVKSSLHFFLLLSFLFNIKLCFSQASTRVVYITSFHFQKFILNPNSSLNYVFSFRGGNPFSRFIVILLLESEEQVEKNIEIYKELTKKLRNHELEYYKQYLTNRRHGLLEVVLRSMITLQRNRYPKTPLPSILMAAGLVESERRAN